MIDLAMGLAFYTAVSTLCCLIHLSCSDEYDGVRTNDGGSSGYESVIPNFNPNEIGSGSKALAFG